MDRAHRLGQRKVVNVHRLIMRGTLEEKVMSLQKFKVSVANAVINAENASLNTMNTDQLLDLFTSSRTNRMVREIKEKKGDGNCDVVLKILKNVTHYLGCQPVTALCLFKLKLVSQLECYYVTLLLIFFLF